MRKILPKLCDVAKCGLTSSTQCVVMIDDYGNNIDRLHLYVSIMLSLSTTEAFINTRHPTTQEKERARGDVMQPYTFFLPLLGTVGYHYTDHYYNNGRWTDLIDNVDCTGTESKLMDCSYDVINQDYHYFYRPEMYCPYGEPKNVKSQKQNTM